MEPGILLKEREENGKENTSTAMGVPYAKAIGSILWAAMVSRPDVMFAVRVLAQFTQNLMEIHWRALKHIIRYLYMMKELLLTFGGQSEAKLIEYCNADWGGQPHRHSISGYSFHMGIGAIMWSSKKQYIIALSSTEAEYIALTHAAKEALWLKTFIAEIHADDVKPIKINCNNQESITLSKDNKFHGRTKHVDIQYHFIFEAVAVRKVTV
jgi:hypothetical protein